MATHSDSSGNAFAELSTAMAQAVQKAAGFTLMVSARRRRPASGVAYAPNLVLTADHVVEHEEGIQVYAGSELLKAALVGRDPVSDLALLRIEQKVLSAAPLGGREGGVGMLALTVGRPDDGGVQAGLAMISAVGGPVRTMRGGLLKRYFRLDATPLPGFSGGALVDPNGDLLGINTSGLSMGVLLSLPASLAWETAAVLEKHGRIKRGYLGVRSQPVEIPASAQTALKRDQTNGLLLVNVEDGSPAGQAGMQVGDILVAIGGEPVSDPDELMAALSADISGKTIAVQVLRGGQPVTMDVKIGER